MELHTNSSNNTIFADADGNIAYFHANFIPKRDTKFDWTKPVDGSDPATEWNGVLVDRRDAEPAESGERLALQHEQLAVVGGRARTARRRRTIPAYVERGRREPARHPRASACSTSKKDFTLDSLIAAGYDSYLPEFEMLIPPLLKAYDAAAGVEPAEGEARRADRAAARRGTIRWSADVGADVARRVLGRGALAGA